MLVCRDRLTFLLQQKTGLLFFMYISRNMSSVLRTFAVKKEGLTSLIKPDSPCYNNGTIDVLFPFSYSNGVLDITYSGNNFKTVMVDVINQAPDSETETAVSILGGTYLATALGDNFKAYIRSWRNGTIDSGSPINIYIAPQLVRVQEASYANIDSLSGDSYKISTQAPASDTYPTGNEENNYQTTFVFKTPLTFTIVESGVIQYITFKTMFDQE